MVDSDSPKDKVQPVVQVGRDKGAFQGSPVLGYEVLGAIGPGWQLYCVHRLAVLAEPQWQPLIVNQETAHTHTPMTTVMWTIQMSLWVDKSGSVSATHAGQPCVHRNIRIHSHACRSAFLYSQKHKDSHNGSMAAMTGFEESVSAVTCTHSRFYLWFADIQKAQSCVRTTTEVVLWVV